VSLGLSLYIINALKKQLPNSFQKLFPFYIFKNLHYLYQMLHPRNTISKNPNHLGNIMSTISDRKQGQEPDPNLQYSYYHPIIKSATDYYAFGSPIEDRMFQADGYRFGFNGQEKDNEIKGEGNSLEFKFRIYDPRLGRFLSIDPLTSKYPFWTPFAFAGNRPIDGVDLEGKEWEQYMMRIIVESKGVTALKVISTSHGSGPIVDATYNLQSRSNRSSFENLKKAYTTNPGIIHNPKNSFASYKPMENPNDGDNQLGVGDHMDIDIMGGVFKDYVRFTDVQVTENSFNIKAATLYGHTDAGTIEFSGTFNSESGIIDFTIHNNTTNNVGIDVAGFGRMAQTQQWKQVLNNVEAFINGDVQSKTLKKEIFDQQTKSGDAKKIVNEDLQNGTSTEKYEEIKN
jgi:RHS repeat-associated protein